MGRAADFPAFFDHVGPRHAPLSTRLMCQRWLGDFPSFLADVGTKPEEKFTLTRLDREGHYSCGKCEECLSKGWPANCKWASKAEQNQTRRTSSRSGKLNPVKVAEIRKHLQAGVSHRSLAHDFGIGESLVGKIGRHEVWKL